MLPFRFGVYASVAPTMSAWRDQPALPRVSVTRPCTFPTILTPSSGPGGHDRGRRGDLHPARGAFRVEQRLPQPGGPWPRRSPRSAWRPRVGSRWVLARAGCTSDYDQSGIEFDELAVRVDRLAESLAVMKRLWTEGKATSTGTYYTVRGAQCDPRPALATSRHGRRREQAAAHACSPRGGHRRDQYEPELWRRQRWRPASRPRSIATTAA